MNKELEKLLREIQSWGCSCSITNGYYCGHREIEDKIRDFLPVYWLYRLETEFGS